MNARKIAVIMVIFTAFLAAYAKSRAAGYQEGMAVFMILLCLYFIAIATNKDWE